jgi:hypothetical protein
MVELASCPYCKHKLETLPKRKKKCPHCGEQIYVRSKRILFNRPLLTEPESIAYDAFKQINYQYGITKEMYFVKEKELTKKFGETPQAGDVIWGIYNDLILMKSKNYQNLSSIYFSMAMHLAKEKKPYFKQLQLSQKTSLLYYKKTGCKKVEILGGNCEECRKNDEKVWDVDEALKLMPIPVKECTHSLTGNDKGWCRCGYIAHLSYDHYRPERRKSHVVKIPVEKQKKGFLQKLFR